MSFAQAPVARDCAFPHRMGLLPTDRAHFACGGIGLGLYAVNKVRCNTSLSLSVLFLFVSNPIHIRFQPNSYSFPTQFISGSVGAY